MEMLINGVNRLPAVILFIVQFSVIILVSFLLRGFWNHVLIRYARKTATNLDRMLFEATDKAVQITFIAAGLSFTWNLYGQAVVKSLSVIPWIDAVFVLKASNHICFLFLTFSLFFLFWRILFSVVDWYEKDIAAKTETTLDEKILYSFRKVVKAVIAVFAVMIVADHFNWPISKVWAAAGIGSLAIALAAKDTFANMISGVIILFDRPFLVGDRVELIDGTFGDVVDIGLRSTKILSFDNTIHIIPNGEISNQRITNHTYPNLRLKVAHNIGVAYGSDMEKVKRVLNDILEEHPHVLNEPPWGIWFTDFGDSSLNLFIRYWILNYKEKFTVVDEINMEINRRFEEEKIEIPFPQRDVHMIK